MKFRVFGMNNVVDMGSHKGLHLRILILIKNLFHNLKVVRLGLSHQNEICSQSFLNSTFAIKGNSLDVGTDLQKTI